MPVESLSEKLWMIEKMVNERIDEIEEKLNTEELYYTDRRCYECLLGELNAIRSFI